MTSRRAFVAGAAGLALGSAGVGAASRVRVDPVEPWSPSPETWPLARYGPANTAANRGAGVPADPAVAWRRDVLGSTVEAALVVGPDAVYAADVTYTEDVVALDRRDGSVRWRYDPPDGQFGGRLALYRGMLYVVAEVNRPGRDIHALDAADGAVRWRAEHGPGDADHLVAADGTLFVGGGGAVGVYDAGGGARRWTADGPSGSPSGVAVHGGGVVATVGDRLVGLGPRSLLDAALGNPPPLAWQAGHVGDPGIPAVGGDRVIVGATVETGEAPDGDPAPAVAAYDADAGERLWGALRSDEVADPPGESALAARVPAVIGDQVVVSFSFRGEFELERNAWPGDHPPEHGVAALSLADGAVLWRRGTDRPVRDVAAAGDAVILATGTMEAGAVSALDPADGRERWRAALGSGVSSAAAVDGTVFAATTDGDVVALR